MVSSGQPIALRRAVADQVDRVGLIDLVDAEMEVVHPLGLPAGLQVPRPFRVGQLVAAVVDIGRRALEDIQVLRVLAEERHALDRGGAGADDRDPLVAEPVEHRVEPVAAGIVIIPAHCVEAVALEVPDARRAGQLRAVERARRHHHEASADVVAPVGAHAPPPDPVVPAQRGYQRAEQRVLVQSEMAADQLAVFEDLGAVGIALLRHVSHFLEQRQVGIGFDVALHAGIAVPVPCAAEIAAAVDDADVPDSRFLQPPRDIEAGKAAAEHDDVDLVGDGLARRGRRIGELEILLILAAHLDILREAFLAVPLLGLAPVFLAQEVEIDFRRIRRAAMQCRLHRLCFRNQAGM
jgi:hypothetical protein